MLPVQFILLLIIVSLPEVGGARGRSVSFPWLALACLVATQLLVAGYAWMRTRRAIRDLHEPASSSSAIMQRADALYSRARWLTILVTAVYMYSTPLPAAVLEALARAHIPRGPDGQFPLLPELLFIFPAVAAWLVIWTAAYYLQSAGRERRLPYDLAQALPVHEMPTLGQYLSMQARHNFFPLVFLILEVAVMWAVYGAVRLFPMQATPAQLADRANNIGAFLAPAVAIIALPWLLIPLWSTTPLTGPLRRRLDAIAKRHRLRFRNILIWRTEHMVVNAAILGWVPFARYFLMSDALLELISDRQIEAVFAHEVGHGVHRHVPWYLVTIVAAFGLAFGLAGGSIWLIQSVFHRPVNETLGDTLFLIYWLAAAGFSIPFISPRFENQADWFACRHLATTLQEGRQPLVAADDVTFAPAPATGEAGITLEAYQAGRYPHAANEPTAVPPMAAVALPAGFAGGVNHPYGVLAPAPLFTTSAATPLQAGAEIFISALDAVVETSHRDRDRRGWMHPSVSSRLKLLRDLAAYPRLAQQFHRRMVQLRLAIVAFFVVGVGSAVLVWALSKGG